MHQASSHIRHGVLRIAHNVQGPKKRTGLRALAGGAQEPGEHLLALYDVMMSQPLWQRRNGSDFAFFQVRAALGFRTPSPKPTHFSTSAQRPSWPRSHAHGSASRLVPPGWRRARRRLRRCGATGAHRLCDRRAGVQVRDGALRVVLRVAALCQRAGAALQVRARPNAVAGITARAAPHAVAPPPHLVQPPACFPIMQELTRMEHVF